MYSPPGHSRGITWIRRWRSIPTAHRCSCRPRHGSPEITTTRLMPAGWGSQILMRPARPRKPKRDVRFWLGDPNRAQQCPLWWVKGHKSARRRCLLLTQRRHLSSCLHAYSNPITFAQYRARKASKRDGRHGVALASSGTPTR
jgi:hypothetical protein